jgi:hypothetical protein
MKPWRAHAVVVSAAVMLSAVSAVADAALPAPPRQQAGAIYSGNIVVTEAGGKAAEPISFRVDRQGTSVIDITLARGYPVYCSPKGIGVAGSTTAKISRDRFVATLPITKNHRRQGTVTVSGTFATRRREGGEVITRFTQSAQVNCSGISPYSTKA